MPAPFSERLREIRLARSLDQKQLAAKSGVSHSLVCRYEAGLRPSLTAVVRLERALGVAPGDLFSAAAEQVVAEVTR